MIPVELLLREKIRMRGQMLEARIQTVCEGRLPGTPTQSKNTLMVISAKKRVRHTLGDCEAGGCHESPACQAGLGRPALSRVSRQGPTRRSKGQLVSED